MNLFLVTTMWRETSEQVLCRFLNVVNSLVVPSGVTLVKVIVQDGPTLPRKHLDGWNIFSVSKNLGPAFIKEYIITNLKKILDRDKFSDCDYLWIVDIDDQFSHDYLLNICQSMDQTNTTYPDVILSKGYTNVMFDHTDSAFYDSVLFPNLGSKIIKINHIMSKNISIKQPFGEDIYISAIICDDAQILTHNGTLYYNYTPRKYLDGKVLFELAKKTIKEVKNHKQQLALYFLRLFNNRLINNIDKTTRYAKHFETYVKKV